MSPWAIGAGAALFLFFLRRPAAAGATPGDVASGAADESAAGSQLDETGQVAYGTYREGQRVQARLGQPYAYFFGRPPARWGDQYPILLPVGAGPNSGEWEAIPGQSSPGRGITGNRGEASEPRFRTEVATRWGHDPYWRPKQPRLHARSRQVTIADAPTRVGAARHELAPNVPEPPVRSLPGVLYRDASGDLNPLVDSWWTTNFSGVGLQPGQPSADREKFRLFIGASNYTAAYLHNGQWYHLPYGEMRARLAFRHPSRGRFPSAVDMRAAPTGTDLWSTGVFGEWLQGATTSGYNPVVTPGIDRVPYMSVNAREIDQTAQASDAASGMRPGPPRMINIFFPPKYFRAHHRNGIGYNPTRVRPGSFDYPSGSRGDLENLATQQWLPYPPTFPVLLAALEEGRRYVKVLRVKGEAEE